MTTQSMIQKINAYEQLMRLDKPIGILLLLWPTLWALWIAGAGRPNWIIVLIFITGTVLMRSAGCVLNDIADRNFDGLVARTQHRPLAVGLVSVKEAYYLAATLVLLAFLAVSFLNIKTIYLSVAALFLAASYPYTKRFLAIPQAYLGIAFGAGIPMAFTAIQNEIPAVAWLLMLANVFWAVAYDTEYAMTDRDDDLKIGIHSSALLFGRFDVLAIMLCYTLMLMLLAYIGWHLGFHVIYFAGLLIALMLVLWQYQLIKTRFKENCFKAFQDNNWIGLVIFSALFSQYLLIA